GVNTLVGENTTTGVNTTVGGNLNTTTGVNTLSGENTIREENINTSTGVNTTIGVNTTVGGNIDPDEIFPNDTVYYGKYKPFFYPGFDTTTKENEIKLYDLRTYSLQNFNGVFSCSGVIATDEEYQKSCIFWIESITGTNTKWILTSLPSFDFSKHSIIQFYEYRNILNHNYIHFKTVLFENNSTYEYTKFMTYKYNCWTLGPIVSYSESSLFTDKPLKVGNEFKTIDALRAKCIQNLADTIHKTDTTNYKHEKTYIVK
ncbi:MAG: hypothetical protein EAZ27_08320, partial [Cytophagales bacterium]